MSIWEFFPDKLTDDKQYDFKKDNFLDSYCGSYSCDGDIEKINAGFFYLFNQFFGSSESSYYAQNNINIVDYIMLWVSYMLNLKETEFNNGLKYFYTTNINTGKYKNSIANFTEHKSYKDLIDQRNYFMGMDRNIISDFYEAFKLLCEMYTIDERNLHSTKCSENANKFVSKYKEMNKNSNITSNSSCKQLLSTLLDDYNKFKNYCNSKGGNCKNYPELPTIEEIQASAQKTVQISEDTSSSSSITTRLFTVLSIFGAIAFFLGISYKYSLFGFRKRFQKQKLREKIKNIKKRMNQ
ncbi:putative yir4 protein [Plasmodium yoelii yoelii]|uniref:Yir4 protein n=3 Tax=Plasmodium yoelii TaxID=5861 RepID=Q7R9N2_PLAYO|nr:putative yir4 protein [Plasmodium yoelii yoelii]WBY57064.1 PIR protein [Plasmodium yoelii yoelii]